MPLPLAGQFTSALLAVTFTAVAVIHVVAARRRSGQFVSWPAVVLAGVGVGYAIAAVYGRVGQPAAWLVIAGTLTVGLYGAVAEMQRRYASEMNRARDAVEDAALATLRAKEIRASQQEHRHEARAALFGIEAAAEGLDRYRALLDPDQFEMLSHGLIAEVRRLRTMIEDQSRETSSFDLREAILPVISCTRAAGLDVRSTVPPGIVVEGVPDSTAQVLRSLLANAQCHAPGSVVEVRAGQPSTRLPCSSRTGDQAFPIRWSGACSNAARGRPKTVVRGSASTSPSG
jgi:signal transduction histidine kinase